MGGSQTVTEILESAQKLVQHRGYNAFAYKDIAEDIGIRGASIHYHFPTKADLGEALVKFYRSKVQTGLDALRSSDLSIREQLEGFILLYQSVTTADGRVCLNCMLAADMPTLPAQVAAEVRESLERNELWLTEVFAAGQAEGVLRLSETPQVEARMFLAFIEGAMLIARTYQTPLAFQALALQALDKLKA